MRGTRSSAIADDRGAAPVEFVLVGALLTVLVLAVLQLGLALYIRNTVLDAAAEGARVGALADRTPADGVARTRELLITALGPAYAGDIRASTTQSAGTPLAVVTVRTPLPLVGPLGLPGALTVSGHAPIESTR